MSTRRHLVLRVCGLLTAFFGVTSITACSDDVSRGGGACGTLIAGDLVLTEFMANPKGEDTGNEWFEIYNATAEPLGLGGVEIGAARADGSDEKRHRIGDLAIEPDAYVVFGGMANEPDLLPSYVDYGFARSLGDFRNTGGTRFVIACGEMIIDEAILESPSDGSSRIFTGDRKPDAIGNDDLGLWCDSTSSFLPDNFGTPGAANDLCEGIGSVTECSEGGVVRSVVAPGPGDLVITELMPNPSAAGDDTGEWFEIYATRDVDLNGLGLGKVIGEDPAELVLRQDCISVAAGSFIVFARSDDPALNGQLPVVDVAFSKLKLNNSASGLVLTRDGEIVDAVTYGSVPDGAALQLDKDFVDATANDMPGYFCRATEPYGAGDLGTPGAVNGDCEIVPPAGMCFDGPALRDVQPPAPGDLIITEFMPNPAAVDDTEGEWFEVRANADFDLSGLALGKVEGEIAGMIVTDGCGHMSAGDYAVIARKRTGNGGLPQVDGTFGFALNNSSAYLWIGDGATVLDEVRWASSGNGIATSLDPALTDPADNDDPGNWCPAIDPYGDGDLGSPGAANPPCGAGGGMCNDGGNPRPIVVPQLGDLVITEMMPDPAAAADTSGEWFEVLVTATVDLNGLQIGRTPGTVNHTLPTGGDCLEFAAGTYVVFAKSTDTALNGGIPADFESGSLSLANAGSMMFIGIADEVLDLVSYGAAGAGVAFTLDPTMEDPSDNDQAGAFCAATDVMPNGDFGTPGAQGPSCG